MTKSPRKIFPVPSVETNIAVPDTLRPALFALIADVANSNTTMKNFNLKDLTHNDLALGNWRITIEKIED